MSKLRKSEWACENCGEIDPVIDHWDDLDGPNRAGWTCSRQASTQTLADEVRAMIKKIKG